MHKREDVPATEIESDYEKRLSDIIAATRW